MSLYLFLIGVVLLIALVVIITYAIYYQKRSFDCYHQPSPQCRLDWQCPTDTCSREQIMSGNTCGKFRVCTEKELQDKTCPFLPQITQYAANQTGKCKSPDDKVLGPGGVNVCKTAWTFLGENVNTTLPIIL